MAEFLLDSDSQCDLMDAVNELHPDLSVELQSTIGNLINQTAKTQRDKVFNQLKQALEQSRSGETIDLPEKWYKLFSAIQVSGVLNRPDRGKILELLKTPPIKLRNKENPIGEVNLESLAAQLQALFPDRGASIHSPEAKLNRPDREKLVEALKKDFRKLYVIKFTTTWQSDRMLREIELDIMDLSNTLALFPEQIDDLKTRLTELEKKLNDREDDLIKAKREEAERIIRELEAIDQVANNEVYFERRVCELIEREREALEKGD